MAQKIYDKQGNIYYFKSSSLNENTPSDQVMNNQAVKQLATSLCMSLNIQKHEMQLTYLFRYTAKINNLDAVVIWLKEQNITEACNDDEFQRLHEKLLVRLNDSTYNFSFT